MNNVESVRQSGGVNWSSPLKPQQTPVLRAEGAAKRALFEGTAEECEIPLTRRKVDLSYRALSDVYKYNFNSPGLTDDLDQFYHIREQVYEIEKKLQTTNHPDQDRIRGKVKAILRMPNYEQTIAELGLVLFYLDRDRGDVFPMEESLVLFRASEMTREVESYIASHEESGASPMIPSGKTHYLMRCFAHMVITNDQVFNYGGAMAIVALLTKSECQVVKYLQPEHLHHILAVVSQILRQPQIKAQLLSPIQVHQELQDVIRIDLKLAPNSIIEPVHAMWDCLMALFSDVRQGEAPNCYAVSAFIYATENSTSKVLAAMLDHLEKGYIASHLGATVPIARLVENRLQHSRVLDFKLARSDAMKLAPFEHLSSTLNLDVHDEGVHEGAMPLKDILENLLVENGEGTQLAYASRLYSAYGLNIFVHSELAILEFLYLNSTRKPFDPDVGDVSFKEEAISACMDAFSRCGDAALQELHSGIKRVLMQRIWVENCNEHHVTHSHQGVRVGAMLIAGEYRGDYQALAEAFRHSMRFFHLKERNYVLLHSITDLQNVIVATIKEYQDPRIKDIDAYKKVMIAGVKSHLYKSVIANYCVKHIKPKPVQARHLDEADLLLFSQIGGREYLVLDLAYGIQVSRQNLAGCETPYRFLQRLLEVLKRFQLGNIQDHPRILITTEWAHAWTLTPHCWQLLLSNRLAFKTFINKTLFEPAKRRLSSVIPIDTKTRVIERFTQDRLRRVTIKTALSDVMSYQTFRDTFRDGVERDSISFLEDIIDQEYSKVSLTKQQLSRVLRDLAVRVEDQDFHELYEALPYDPVLPYTLACKLRLLLIEHNGGIVHPYEIEISICKEMQLPLPIEVGDLNYYDYDREDPGHQHAIVDIAWRDTMPHYFQRDASTRYILSNRSYNWFGLQYPRIIEHNQAW